MRTVINKMKTRLIKMVEGLHRYFFGCEISGRMREFLQNLSWSFFGGIGAAVIMFGISVVAGRILGPEEYGKYGLVVAIASIFIIPMTMGIDTAVVHYTAKEEAVEKKRRYLSSALLAMPVLIGLTALFLFYFGEKLFFWFGVDFYLLKVIIVFAIFLSLKNIFDAFLKGLHLFKKQSFIRIGEAIVMFMALCCFLFCLQSFNFFNFLEVILVGYFFFIFLTFLSTKKYFRFKVYLSEIKKIFSYGGYVIFGAISGILLNNLDKILINKYIGVEQLGIYNAYSTMSLLVVGQLMVIFVNVFFPMLSASGDKRVVLLKVNKIARLLFWPSFFLMCLVVVMGILLFGRQYPLDFLLVTEFSFLAVVIAYFTVLWWLLSSQGKWGVRFTAFNGIMAGLIFLSLTLFFRNILSLNLIILFLILGYFYAIVIGNIKGIRSER